MDFTTVPLARLDAETMQDLLDFPYEATDTDDEELVRYLTSILVQNWILNTRLNQYVRSVTYTAIQR